MIETTADYRNKSEKQFDLLCPKKDWNEKKMQNDNKHNNRMGNTIQNGNLTIIIKSFQFIYIR